MRPTTPQSSGVVHPELTTPTTPPKGGVSLRRSQGSGDGPVGVEELGVVDSLESGAAARPHPSASAPGLSITTLAQMVRDFAPSPRDTRPRDCLISNQSDTKFRCSSAELQDPVCRECAKRRKR